MNFANIEEYLNELNNTFVPATGLKIWKNHKELFSRVSGYSDSEQTKPAAIDDIYLLWSMSKVVTAVAILRLVEQDKLSLNDRLDRFFPEFSEAFYMRNDKRIKVKRAPTVFELLTMTAGFTYDVNTENLERFIDTDADTQTVIKALAKEPFGFEPGAHFRYSLCCDVLGAVAEKVTGTTFGEYLKKEIFKPLGMCDTGFHLNEDMKRRRSTTFRMNRELKKSFAIDERPLYLLSNAFEGGGAGLFSTLPDYIKFSDALACGGTAYNGYKLLKKETVDEMCKNQLNDIQLNDFWESTSHFGHGYGYCVSVLTEKKYDFHCPLGVFGWGGAAGCRTFIDPKNHISIVYVQEVMDMNTGEYMTHPHNKILNLTYDCMEKGKDYE